MLSNDAPCCCHSKKCGHLSRCASPDRAGIGKSRLARKSQLAYDDRVADVFSAIADQTRRAILDELADKNGQTLFEICTRLVMKHGLSSTRQAISQHLDVLESAGLLTSRREGRYKFHFFNPAPLHTIAARWPVKNEEETV
jgi:DNA-binding transcriptional ArsR family regulator